MSTGCRQLFGEPCIAGISPITVTFSTSLSITQSFLQYHVITYDYRGFADSEDIIPNEETMVEDAFNVYDHVEAQCSKVRTQ